MGTWDDVSSWAQGHKAVVVAGGGATVLAGAFVVGRQRASSSSPPVATPVAARPMTTGVTADGTTVQTPVVTGIGLSDPWVDIFTTRLDLLGEQVGGLSDRLGLLGNTPGPSKTTEPLTGLSPGGSSPSLSSPLAPVVPNVNVNPGTLLPIFSSPVGLGGGQIVGGGTVSNPVAAIQPTETYTPSAMDILSSLQPFQYQLVTTPGSDVASGHTYTVYDNNLGTGAVIPPSSRIVGERYDSFGRVIL